MTMSFVTQEKKDWFEWAESHVTDWKARDTEWRGVFSPQAEEVLGMARQAALSLQHAAVGAEHLLAGLLKLNSGPAARALKSAGLSLPALRVEISAERGRSMQEKMRRNILWTPRAKGIIQRARDTTRAGGHVRVEPEDLFLELLIEEDGLPARIFRKRSMDLQKIRMEVMARKDHP